MRGQDISTLTPDRVTGLDDGSDAPILWAKRKAAGSVILMKGEFTPNPVCTHLACSILSRRRSSAVARGGGDEFLFPYWDPQHATTLVQAAATERNWSDQVLWTGAHQVAGAGRVGGGGTWPGGGGAWPGGGGAWPDGSGAWPGGGGAWPGNDPPQARR